MLKEFVYIGSTMKETALPLWTVPDHGVLVCIVAPQRGVRIFNSYIFDRAETVTTMSKGPVGDWYNDAGNINGLLLDIFGVLYENSDEGPVAIPGSIEAVKK